METIKICSKDNCQRKRVARGLCNNHYQQWRNSQPESIEKVQETRRKTRLKNSEAIRTYRKKYWAENKETIEAKRKIKNKAPLFRFNLAVASARQAGLQWELEFEQFKDLISMPCTYCQAAPPPTCGKWIDRVDSSKGYTKDNAAPCCGKCNRIKNNFLSKEETVAVIALIKEMRGGVAWTT